MEQKSILLKNDSLSVIVSTLGAELKSIQTSDGVEHLHQPDAFWQDQAPILFPVCGTPVDGKIRFKNKEYPMDSHGFAKSCLFEILDQTDEAAILMLSASEETKKIYPFDFKLEISFELKENTLYIRHKVQNCSIETMYFSIGYHEGYQCPEGLSNYEIHFEKKETTSPFVFETRKCPDKFLDIFEGHSVLRLSDELFQDAITVVYENLESTSIILKNINNDNEIKVSFPEFDRLLIWTFPESTFVCIEPWCGMAEFEPSKDLSLMPGIHALKPEEIFVGKHKITF